MATVISVAASAAPLWHRSRHTKFHQARDSSEHALASHTCTSTVPHPNSHFLSLINAPLPFFLLCSPLNPHILISSPGPISRSAVPLLLPPLHCPGPRGLFFPNSTEHNIRNLSRQRQTDEQTRQEEKTGDRRGANYRAHGCDTYRAENQVKRRERGSIAYKQPISPKELFQSGAPRPRLQLSSPSSPPRRPLILPAGTLLIFLPISSSRYQIIGPFLWSPSPPIRVKLPFSVVAVAVCPALHDDLMTKNFFA